MDSNTLIQKNISLKKYTSWLVGGKAEFYCAPKNEDDLKSALSWAFENKKPWTVLGGGTNALISDQGISGLVIHTHEFKSVAVKSVSDQIIIEALGGTPKSDVLKEFMKLRLRPAIFLAGLPGDMAGGVVMNAGVGHKTSPTEFCEIVKSIDVLRVSDQGKLSTHTIQKNEIDWSYRKSNNWQPGIISKVRVTWPNEPDDNVLKEVRDGNVRRKSTQPLNMPSCGSVFKNPLGEHSGALIEKAGLKGFSIGGAQVSEKHGNFVVNTGNGTASEIHQVIKHVQSTIKEKFSIDLVNEVVYMGRW